MILVPIAWLRRAVAVDGIRITESRQAGFLEIAVQINCWVRLSIGRGLSELRSDVVVHVYRDRVRHDAGDLGIRRLRP